MTFSITTISSIMTRSIMGFNVILSIMILSMTVKVQHYAEYT